MKDVQLIVPLRSFDGMTRLAELVSAEDRHALSRALFSRIVEAGTDAGLRVQVVTRNDQVADWCRDRDIASIRDPGGGLDAAAATAVRTIGGRRWVLAHADLPLVDAASLAHVAHIGGTVLAPSLDGGTNVIAGYGDFPFSYGLGSFHRHLAATPDATIVSRPELSIDVDTSAHLGAIRRLSPTLTFR